MNRFNTRILSMLLRFLGLLAIGALAAFPCLASWKFQYQRESIPASPTDTPKVTSIENNLASVTPDANQALLQQSWTAYRQRFIQSDGRVIDWEAKGITTSEGQAYAMLRSVLIDDPTTFELTLRWAENNLQHQTAGKRTDQLWAWKWGQTSTGNWGILDGNFASDADIDAITALILASRRWQRPDYMVLARTKLRDLWQLSTLSVRGQTYLLPGPAAAFQQQSSIQLNPSYLAPYAFRLFAQVDPARDWLSLVRSSYLVLEKSATLSTVGLPSDWVELNTSAGNFAALSDRSNYGFDAYRVWWRIALDASWFDAPEAKRYLSQHLNHLQTLWRSRQFIPARINLQGQSIVNYDATSQYGMLYSAFRLVNPEIAEQIFQQKLSPRYRDGFWDNNSAYYTQNLVWFGLFPATNASSLVQTSKAVHATTPP